MSVFGWGNSSECFALLRNAGDIWKKITDTDGSTTACKSCEMVRKVYGLDAFKVKKAKLTKDFLVCYWDKK